MSKGSRECDKKNDEYTDKPRMASFHENLQGAFLAVSQLLVQARRKYTRIMCLTAYCSITFVFWKRI